MKTALVKCSTCGKEIERVWKSNGIAHKYKCYACKAEQARQRQRKYYHMHKALQRKIQLKREYVRRGATIPKNLMHIP